MWVELHPPQQETDATYCQAVVKAADAMGAMLLLLREYKRSTTGGGEVAC